MGLEWLQAPSLQMQVSYRLVLQGALIYEVDYSRSPMSPPPPHLLYLHRK